MLQKRLGPGQYWYLDHKADTCKSTYDDSKILEDGSGLDIFDISEVHFEFTTPVPDEVTERPNLPNHCSLFVKMAKTFFHSDTLQLSFEKHHSWIGNYFAYFTAGLQTGATWVLSGVGPRAGVGGYIEVSKVLCARARAAGFLRV